MTLVNARPLRGLLALLALLSTPALGADLAGLYRVEGKLPGGQDYTALAAWSGAGPDGYRVRLVGTTAGGAPLKLTALARSTAVAVEVRYRGTSGLSAALPGATSTTALLGRYRLAADGASFAGPLSRAGSSAVGRASYARQALPACAFAQASVEVDVDAPAQLLLRGPADALPFVVFEADGTKRTSATSGGLRLRLSGLAPGEHVVKARLGGAAGLVLAEARVVVGAPAASVMDEVVAEVERLAADRPLVVFDLDDTLFETRTRSSTIVREWGEQNAEARLAAIRPEHVRFGLEDTLVAAGLTEAEAWGDLGKAVRRYWSPRFFNGSYFHHDTAMPGAVDFVRRLHDAGARIVYLSGRKANTLQVCREALVRAGFPAGDGTTLYVKPDPAPGQPKEETADWKGRVVKGDVAPLGPVVAAFDNEPVNCNALRANLPGARVVFVDTLYKPDSPALLERIERMPGTYE